jgi:hypothetical protein
MSRDLFDTSPRRQDDGALRGEPTLADVEHALRVVADVIRLHGTAYLPIFDRLEREKERLAREQAQLDRAVRLSAGAV